MDKKNDVIEIDLREIFGALLHWWWLILVASLLTGGIAFIVSKMVMTPIYESTTRVAILNRGNNDNLTYSDLQMGTQLTKDYAQLVQSRYVIELVAQNLGLEMSYEGLVSKVKVTTSSDTRIMDITVSDPSPALAKQIADEIRVVASERIKEVFDISAVNIVDEGNIPLEPASPSVKKYTAIGLLLGAFIIAAIVIIQFLLDDTIKTSEDVEKYLQLSTLALIPIISTDDKKKKRKFRLPLKRKRTPIPAKPIEEDKSSDKTEDTENADTGFHFEKSGMAAVES